MNSYNMFSSHLFITASDTYIIVIALSITLHERVYSSRGLVGLVVSKLHACYQLESAG